MMSPQEAEVGGNKVPEPFDVRIDYASVSFHFCSPKTLNWTTYHNYYYLCATNENGLIGKSNDTNL